MFAPRFSLRSLMLFTVACSMVAWVGYQAARGAPWAIGGIFGFGSLIVMALAHVAVFALASVVAWSVDNLFERRPVAQSPFAGATLPPRPVTSESE